MSDRYSKMFAAYASATTWDRLAPEVIHEVKRRILDSIGVATAAFDEDAPEAARRYARAHPDPRGATIWGTGLRAGPRDRGLRQRRRRALPRFQRHVPLARAASSERCHPGAVRPGRGPGPLPEGPHHGDRPGLRDPRVAVRRRESASPRLGSRELPRDRGGGGSRTAARAGARANRARDLHRHRAARVDAPDAGRRASMWKGAAAANSARNAVFAALLSEAGYHRTHPAVRGRDGLLAVSSWGGSCWPMPRSSG